MDPSIYLWFGIMLATLIIAPLSRHRRGKKVPVAQEFMMCSLALYTAIQLSEVLLKVVTHHQLQTIIGQQGTIMLCISSALGVYLSLREFSRIF